MEEGESRQIYIFSYFLSLQKHLAYVKSFAGFLAALFWKSLYSGTLLFSSLCSSPITASKEILHDLGFCFYEVYSFSGLCCLFLSFPFLVRTALVWLVVLPCFLLRGELL